MPTYASVGSDWVRYGSPMRLVATFVLVVIVLGGACIPTAARKSARVEPGLDVDFSGGSQYLLEGEDENGATTEVLKTGHAELDLQWGAALEDDDAIAFQLKVPATLVHTALDVFYQLPSTNRRRYFGYGAEFSIAPALYIAATQYLTDALYLTFTPRVLTQFDNVSVNPQVAVGFESGPVDFSVFVAYLHVFGDGFNIKVDLPFRILDEEDFRNDFALLGGSIRF